MLPLGGLQRLVSGKDLVSRGPGDGMSWDTEGTEGMVLERPLKSPSGSGENEKSYIMVSKPTEPRAAAEEGRKGRWTR